MSRSKYGLRWTTLVPVCRGPGRLRHRETVMVGPRRRKEVVQSVGF